MYKVNFSVTVKPTAIFWAPERLTWINYGLQALFQCSGINKPVAVRDWLNKTQPKEDYILVIDSDTVMREPFDMETLDLKPGKMPSSAFTDPYQHFCIVCLWICHYFVECLVRCHVGES